MGQKAVLKKAAAEIHGALQRFVNTDETENIIVFESSPGNLRVVLGSKKFEGVGAAERQERIWEFLKKEVAEHDLQYCWGVHPLNLDEYEDYAAPLGSSSSAFPLMGDSETTDDIHE